MQYIYNMKFDISCELSYEVFSPTTFIFNIQAIRSANQIIIEESILINPILLFEEFTIADTRFVKLEVNQGASFTISYHAQVDVEYKIIDEGILLQHIPIVELDTHVLPYLFPSRHCQSDKLRKLATKEFGNFSDNYSKVLAINNWIFNNTDYITGTTDSGSAARSQTAGCRHCSGRRSSRPISRMRSRAFVARDGSAARSRSRRSSRRSSPTTSPRRVPL